MKSLTMRQQFYRGAFFVGIIAAADLCAAAPEKQKIVLKNPVLHMLDGKRWMLDGYTFRDMLHIRREGRKLQYGEPNKKSNKLEGKYEYNGARYPFHALAKIEKELFEERDKALRSIDEAYVEQMGFDYAWQQEYSKLQIEHDQERLAKEQQVHRALHKDDVLDMEHMQMRSALRKKHAERCALKKEEVKMRYVRQRTEYDQAVAEVTHTFEQNYAALRDCLRQVKADIQKINEPYLDQIAGTKAFLCKLVQEWCQLTGRHDSFLNDWSSVPEGGELAAFEANMKTLQDVDTFCTDLSSFFEALIGSCPKGWAQYLELVKQK